MFDSKIQPSNDRGHLLTEQSNPRSTQLDRLATTDLVKLFIKENRFPQQAVAAAANELTAAVDAISDRLRQGGRLFYLGAGTSGRLGVLDAAECPPTFCNDPSLVQGVLAGGSPALLRSSESLEDLDESGRDDLHRHGFQTGDCLVGITAGGTTPYVLGGLFHARSIGALAIAIACVPSDQAPLPCDIDIRLLTGPELLTGSTRLKAGTATKMALNILSTTVMVRLGKVYGNRMIDMATSNGKLMDRSLRILRDLVGVKREQGLALLASSGGSVKLALLMKAAGLSRDQARLVLEQHDQHLRAALDSCGVTLTQL
ncbi:N-acetylmuramic acid 6-phosphate etherase [Synechococcus sp. M16CYN]|uniref:N-acetylmuramic acid 6-phosphate etherase n=1 Tax=Synechococcus sp. M16CYN TaxID=3103139 RepID=UPI0032495009